MRSASRRAVLLGALLLAASLSCGREVTAPEGGSGVARGLSFAPAFPAALRDGGGASLVAFERVRVVFRRTDGSVAFDKLIDFPADADSVPVALDVPLSAGTSESGESLALSLFYLDAAGDTVFAGGPTTVVVRPSKPGAPPPPPIPVTLRYVGTGAEAASVVLSPGSVTTRSDSPPTQFSAVAFAAGGTPLPGTPVRFRSSDTTVVRVSETGLASPQPRRGVALVVAELLTGPADTATFTVGLPPAAIGAVAGSGQSAPAGTTLSQPIVARVLAADSVPVAGVTVTFSAATGNGAPGAGAVQTDANGFASTTWTLGNTVGAQVLTATAAGVAGATATFTATATPGVPAALAFVTQPSAVAAGTPIAPAVVVEVRTAGGLVAAGFSDSVTVVLGSNPGSATLGGTRTVAAVNGVATFAGLTLDRAAAGYTLVASAGALTPATSSAFTVGAAAPSALAWVQQPAGGSPGLPLTPAPSVRAVDAFGNAAAFAGTVTVALGANPGGTSLGGTTSVAAVGGVAAFPDLTLGATGSGYTLVASATGLAGATSAPFNIGAQTIAWANAGGGAWSVAANWNLNRVPEPSDVVEIALPGTYTVSLDVNANVAGLLVGTGTAGTQTLQASGRTLTVAGDLSVGSRGALALSGSSVTGAGALVNGGSVTLAGSSLGLALDNRATLVASGNSALNGAVTTGAGSTLRVAQADGTNSFATLTVADGFTNTALLEISNQFTAAYGAQLIVTSGTLVNAAGATLAVLGGQTPGGARTLTAQLDNQGTLDVQVPLTLNRANAAHLNSGTIAVAGGNLTIALSGIGPSFSSTGTLAVGAGHTLSVNGGAMTQAGTLDGAGTLTVTNGVLNLSAGFSNAVTTLTLGNTTINGPATLTNAAGRTLTLVASTVNAPLVNEGTLVASGNSAINGSFTTGAGSTLRVAQADGTNSFATLTVANGFTNTALLEISNQFAAAYGAQLIVTNGTLVNAAGATIAVLGGQTPGGARNLGAQLDNQGTLDVQVPLTLGRANAAHLNSGTIAVAGGNLAVQLTGTPASLANTGTISVAAGRTLSVNGGSLTQAGTLDGAGTLAITNATLALSAGFSNAVTTLTLGNTTINGPATLTNAAGQTLTLVGSTVNAPLVNDGTLIASGTSAINGSFTTGTGSTLRVAQADGTNSFATLTVANGFTNTALLEISNQFNAAYGAQLIVTNGTLVNAAGATIAVLGGQTPGGARNLGAQLDNQGALDVQVPLTLNRASAAHLNSGTIAVAGGNLTISQSGTGPSFSNTGTITVGAGRTLSLNGGTFTQAGTLDGAGTLAVTNATLSLSAGFSNAVTALTTGNTTINGPATLTNATGQTLTLVASTVNAPLVNDGTLIASGTSAINGTLTTGAGSTLRVAQVDGSNSFASLTVANGFTNTALIELSNQFTVAYGAQLLVTSGTLVNAPGATIVALGGQTPGGARNLGAQLDNQGVLRAETGLSLNRASAAHLNSGTVELTTGSLTITQSGTSPRFTNTGTITIGSGLTLAVSSGAFTNEASGTLSGAGLALGSVSAAFNGAPPAVATFTATSSTVSFAAPLSNATTAYTIANSTFNGAGPFVNAAGQTQTLVASTLNMPVDNQGTLVASGSSAITGALTTSSSSLIRVGQVDGSNSQATLTVASGFTNAGTIELTNQFGVAYAAQLIVTSGTLVNAPGATIAALGGTTPGGGRTLAAQLDNQGTLDVQVPLSLNRASAVHVNSGTVQLTTGNLTITQSGTGPSFTNTGTLTIGTGRTLTISGGSFVNDVDGTLDGAALALGNVSAAFNGATPALATFTATNSTVSFASPLSNAATAYTLANSTFNGAGPFVNAAGQTQTLVASTLNMPVDNQGTLVASGSSAIGGALTTAAGSVIRIGQIDGTNSTAQLTVANGFTNAGTIELTVQFGVAYNALLTVTNGTLLNTGTIVALGGQTPGGGRTLAVQLDNQGTLDAQVPLSLNRASADHLNSGTVTLSGGDLSIPQSGTTPSFVNSGTIAIGTGRTLSVSSGAFTSTATGTISGGTFASNATTVAFQGPTPAVEAMTLVNSPTSFAGPVSTASTTFTLSATTQLSGPGPFTNAAGRTLTLVGASINMPFDNQGTLVASGTSSLFGALTTAAGSVIRVGQVDGASSTATLTVANGFTNAGTIELTNQFTVAYNTQLTVTSGALVNGATGVLLSLAGTAGGGTRTITANGGVENQGIIDVGGANAAGLLTVNSTTGFTNAGTIALELGGLTAGTQHDRLAINGPANLGGTLTVGLIGAYVPVSGNAFQVLTHGTRTGTFATATLSPPLAPTPAYNAANVTVSVP